MRFLAIVAVLSAILSVAAAPAPDEKKTEPAALKLKRALDETGDVAFDGSTFEDLQNFFKSRLKSPVQLDPSMAMSFEATTPMFNYAARGLKYRDALRNALATRGFAYANVGGTVVIGTEDAVLQRQMRQTVSLDAKDETLGNIIKRYADETGVNLVMDPREATKAGDVKITFKLEDVAVETAVRLAMEVGGLRVVRMNNVLFVTSDARADKLRLDTESMLLQSSGGPGVYGLGGLGGGGGGVVIPPNAALPIPPPPPPPAK